MGADLGPTGVWGWSGEGRVGWGVRSRLVRVRLETTFSNLNRTLPALTKELPLFCGARVIRPAPQQGEDFSRGIFATSTRPTPACF